MHYFQIVVLDRFFCANLALLCLTLFALGVMQGALSFHEADHALPEQSPEEEQAASHWYTPEERQAHEKHRIHHTPAKKDPEDAAERLYTPEERARQEEHRAFMREYIASYMREKHVVGSDRMDEKTAPHRPPKGEAKR